MTNQTNMDNNENTTSAIIKQKRVCIYLRTSSDEQKKHGYGIKTQYESAFNFIRENSKNGWTFDKSKHLFVDEGESGSFEDRPSFDEMKRAIVRGEINIILVARFDRLFRDVKFCLTFIDSYCTDGIELKSVLESYINTKSDEGRMFLTFSQTMSENERKRNTKIMMDGKRYKARLGFSVCGTVKFGFTRKKGEKPVINEAEASIVRRIFDLFVNEGKTQSEIAKILTKDKIPTRSDIDSKSSKKTVNGYAIWTQEKISDYLRSEVYIGNGYFGKTLQKKVPGGKIKTIIRPREEWILQKYPVIIDEETFKKAQELLDNKSNPSRKKHCRKYLLTSISECGKCQRGYQGYTSGKGTIQYRCNGGKSRMRVEHPCDNKEVSGAKLEKFTWGIIVSLLSDPKRFSKEFERISNVDSKLSKYISDLETVNKNLEQEGRRIKEAYYMKLSAGSQIASLACDDIIKTVNGQIDYFSKQQEELTQLIKTENEKLAVSKNIDVLSKLYKKNLAVIENHFETKEKLIKALIKRIEIGEKVLKVYFQFDNPSTSKNNNGSHLICMEYSRELLK